jgi:DnaJ-domain-containing protein 1
MPRQRDPNKPKRNVWTDQSPYGTYVGPAGSAAQWRQAFSEAMGREEAEEILSGQPDSPWVILGVSPNATQDEIKHAYRMLMLRFHPDRCGNTKESNERAKRIIAAYTVLKK